jgi:hypothetical protein
MPIGPQAGCETQGDQFVGGQCCEDALGQQDELPLDVQEDWQLDSLESLEEGQDYIVFAGRVFECAQVPEDL